MRSAARDLVRAEVRALLEASPAYGGLSPAPRRELAQGMVQLGSYLAEDPRWLAERAPEVVAERLRPIRDALPPPVARALDQSQQGTGSGFHAGATGAAAEEFRGIVGSVDFSAFVSGLIKGVFQAIVDASIEQMRAYQDLVSAAVSSVSKFESDISDEDSSGYLASQYPSSFGLAGGLAKATGDGSVSDQLIAELSLPRGSNLTDPGTLRLAMTAARQKMAAQRQQNLATIVMMGINRIVVTDGRINARVLFDVSAKDTATEQRSTDTTSTTSRNTQTKSKSFWGTSNTTDTRSTSLSVRTASSAKDAAEVSLHAQLSGEVSVNFKSETFPLERLAAGQDLQRIQRNAQPAQSS